MVSQLEDNIKDNVEIKIPHFFQSTSESPTDFDISTFSPVLNMTDLEETMSSPTIFEDNIKNNVEIKIPESFQSTSESPTDFEITFKPTLNSDTLVDTNTVSPPMSKAEIQPNVEIKIPEFSKETFTADSDNFNSTKNFDAANEDKSSDSEGLAAIGSEVDTPEDNAKEVSTTASSQAKQNNINFPIFTRINIHWHKYLCE